MLSLNKTLGHLGIALCNSTLALSLLGAAALIPGCVAGSDEPCSDGACEGELGDGLDVGSGEAEDVGEAESALGVNDVGVIPASACPSNFEQITIFMDDEDTSNGNDHGGWIGATQSNSNTRFIFCRVAGSSFKPLNTGEPYAVLKLGGTCPAGSEAFSRTFDNEDTSNSNSSTGNIFPNTSTQSPSKTTLAFCLFRGSASAMSTFPNLGFNYGILARANLSKSVGVGWDGWIETDDEDTANGNSMSFSWSALDFAKTNDALQIVSNEADSKTRLRMTRVQ
ncbi:hypothetical protein WME90_35170 [Sorangium sp. So ce375]|uniref:hypothetical protein n=1 Tax=Sorangium sp. So ce375 TaxID=3133306 RepID=UPI003F5C3D3B